MKFPMILIALLFTAMGYPKVYFVSNAGSDSNPGTQAKPFATIGHAAKRVAPSDVVRVKEGRYPERATLQVAGKPGQPITYLAEGRVVVHGFVIKADHNRIFGFEITHPKDLGHAGVNIEFANYVEISECHIHHTSMQSIDPVGSQYLVLRGNIFSYSGSPGGKPGKGFKSIDDWGETSNHMLIEYNRFSHTTDYICSNGDYYLVRNNVLGPTVHGEFGDWPHVDGWQANSQTRYGIMESNWHVDNSNSDSHMILIAAPVKGENAHFAVVKNVSLRSGDNLWYQMRDGDHLHAAHNSVGQVGYGPRNGPGYSGFFYVWSQNTPSLANVSLNNIFYNVTKRTVYTVNPGNQLVHGYDHVDVGQDIVHGVDGNIKSDPTKHSWVNYNSNDLTLKAGAPDIDAGAELTVVVGGDGDGKTFKVKNPDWFYDGYGLTQGHLIYVGTQQNLRVVKVDYRKGEITVNRKIQWKQGAPVGYRYRGKGPDLGAYEYGDELLKRAKLAKHGNEYRVTVEGDARFVVFYRNGLPYLTDFEAPYTLKSVSGVISASAFALHAQDSPIIKAE